MKIKLLPIFSIAVLFLIYGLSYSQTNPRLNAYWSSNIIGSAGPVQYGATASVMDRNGTIYIAGNFQLDNETPIRVAKWSGGRWQLLGDRIYDDNQFLPIAIVNAMAVDASGNVYIGGLFNRAVNSSGAVVQCSNILKWNNASGQWESLGTGVDDDVFSIAVNASGDIFVCGTFTGCGNPDGSIISTQRLAMWNSTQSVWHPLGDGLPVFTNGLAQQIVVDDNGNVVVAGTFSEIYNSGHQAVAVSNIAQWTGSSWQPLAGGLQSSQSSISVTRMQSDGNGNLYVFGDFDAAVNGNSSHAPGPLVSWDGTSWTSIGGINSVIQRDMAIDGLGNIYLLYDQPGFLNTLERWDGNSWTRLMEKGSFPVPTTIASHQQFGNAFCYMGGNFNGFQDITTGMEAQIANNALWRINQWRNFQTSVGLGSSGEVFALSTDNRLPPSHLYVGGNFVSVDTLSANNIARLDGRNWDPLGRGVNGPVYAIEAVTWPWNGAFVGGIFTEATNPDCSRVSVRNLAFWDNRTLRWYNVGGFDGAVNALELVSGPIRLVAGGDFNTAGGNQTGPVAQFDFFAQTWESLGGGLSGQSSAVVNSITSWSHRFTFTGSTLGEVIIGGIFDNATNPDGSQVPVSNIAIWSTHHRQWISPGGGLDGEVLAVARIGHLSGTYPLWVGGRFQNAINRDGTVIPAPYVVRWQNYEWRQLAGGVDGPVHAITIPGFNSRAIIGGEFTNVINPDNSTTAANHIALFEYTQQPSTTVGWNLFGSGLNGNVYALQSVSSCFRPAEIAYVGGDFTVAGVRPSRSLAKWKYPFPPYRGRATLVSASYRQRSNASGRQRVRAVAAVRTISCTSPLAKTTQEEIEEIVLADNLGFGQQITTDNLPLLTPFDLLIYDADSPFNPLFTVDSLVARSESPQLFVITGVDDPAEFSQNPDGRNTTETIIFTEVPVDESSNDVTVLFVHSITDAPALAMLNAAGDTLAAALSYGDVSQPVKVAAGNHTYNLVTMETGQQITSLSFDFSGDAGETVPAVLNGFVDPASNQGGPPVTVLPVEIEELPVSVHESSGNTPKAFSLMQNYPNPFNPVTTIQFALPENAIVTLKIYDLLGRQIETLIDEEMHAGNHKVNFDAKGLPSGIYFYKMRAGEFTKIKKLTVLK